MHVHTLVDVIGVMARVRGKPGAAVADKTNIYARRGQQLHVQALVVSL